MDVRNPRSTQAIGNRPFKLIADAISQHGCAKRRQNRDLACLDIRIDGEDKSELHSLAGVWIEEFGTAVHRDDVGGKVTRVHDFGTRNLGFQSVGSTATAFAKLPDRSDGVG